MFLGIYEFRCYRLKPGMLAQWTHRFSQGIEDRLKFSSPLGIWCAETGPLNTSMHLLMQLVYRRVAHMYIVI